MILEPVLREQLPRFNTIDFKGEQYNFSDANIHEAIQSIREIPFEGLLRTNENVYDRAQIVLAASTGVPNRQIVREHGIEEHRVGIWRRRWHKKHEAWKKLDPELPNKHVGETDLPVAGRCDRSIAKKLGITDDLGEKDKHGILKSMASRKMFLSDKTHRIRFVYTPKHCSWLNQIENWFSGLVRRVLNRGSFRSTKDLKTKILHYFDFYNQTAKPMKWMFRPEKMENPDTSYLKTI